MASLPYTQEQFVRQEMNPKFSLIMLFVPSLLGTCHRAAAPERLPWSQELQAALDKELKSSGGTGVSAAIRIAGEGEWSGVSGISDIKRSQPIAPDMVFDVASVGKTFTAALVLQLAEEGKLSLDDPLHKWLPDFPKVNHNATIRQLLNHTSGISHFAKNQQYWQTVFAYPDSLWAPEEVLAFVPEPRFPPGGGWNYSSTNYVLLGMIIEKVGSTTLSTQLRTRFLVPFELTSIVPSVGDRARESRVLAHGHFDLNGDGQLDDLGIMSRNSLFSSAWAAGPVVSTAEDLARWADYLYGGRILQRESLEEMTNFYRPTPGEPLISGYGLGTAEIQAGFLDGERIWGHLGWNPGYMTAMLYFPDRSVSLTVLINDNNEKCISSITAGLWNVVRNHLGPIKE